MDALLLHAQGLAEKPCASFLPISNRIAYVVSHGQSYASNGYAVRTQGIAQALNEHGFETLCFVRPGRPWSLSKSSSIEIEPEVKVKGVRYIHTRTEPSKNEQDQLEKDVAHYIELFTVYRPQVVVAASNYQVGLPAWVAACRLGLPFFNEVRGFWELSRAARDLNYDKTAGFLLERHRDTFVAKKAHSVFTLNEPMKKELIRRGVCSKKIILVPNAVASSLGKNTKDLNIRQKFGITDSDKVIGFIGSFNNYEGLDLLIDACKGLNEKRENIKLLLVGNENAITVEKGTVNSLMYNPWLIQAGRVSHEEVANYYNAIDVIVIPRKKYEVCSLVPPLKAVEALAYKKILVVPELAPFEEYIQQNKQVISFKAGCVIDLKESIEKALVMADSFEEKPFNEILYFKSHVFNIIKKIRDAKSIKSSGLDNNKNKKTSSLIFTNLGLSTIDGSSVFIANIVNIHSKVFDEVHLLSVQDIGPNFNDRIKNLNNVQIHFVQKDLVKEKIYSLDKKINFNTIFVRGWGARSLWFDNRYAQKISYYWPLTENPTKDDVNIFHSVGEVAYQTVELKEKTEKLLGKKRNILIPPLVDINLKDHIGVSDNKVTISYIGTLRKECYSYDLLKCLIKIADLYKDKIKINLAIGKIFYQNYKEKKEVITLLEKMSKFESVSIEEQVSQLRCNELLSSSDISFSLWEPNPQNSIQISTKMLDCLSSGCNVICFRTKLHENILGKNYNFFIDDINELEAKIYTSIESISKNKKRFYDNYALSFFSMDWHILNLINHYNIPHLKEQKYKTNLFSKQFDNIYGVYINESEKKKLEFFSKENRININYFKGINGKVDLKDQYDDYINQPLLTKWEQRAQRKRLTLGAMGHLASFISVLKDAISQGYRKILILESDVLLHKNFFSLNFKIRPQDFKVFYLGAGKWNTDLEYIDDRYYRPKETTGTFAIAIDRDLFEPLIEKWSEYIEPSDVAMWPITDAYKDECYVAMPNLVICDVATSLTGSGRSQKNLSNKFGWELTQYNLKSTEYINKYISKCCIYFDHILNNANIKLICQFKEINIPVSGLSLSIEVNDVVIEILHENLFIKNIELID